MHGTEQFAKVKQQSINKHANGVNSQGALHSPFQRYLMWKVMETHVLNFVGTVTRNTQKSIFPDWGISG
jgi:hypothetical protein